MSEVVHYVFYRFNYYQKIDVSPTVVIRSCGYMAFGLSCPSGAVESTWNGRIYENGYCCDTDLCNDSKILKTSKSLTITITVMISIFLTI